MAADATPEPPLRVALIALHRRVALREPLRNGARIGIAMLPTLVFTLVIAEILRDQFAVPRAVFGGLIIYTLANTLIPGFLLHMPTAELRLAHQASIATGRATPPDAEAGTGSR